MTATPHALYHLYSESGQLLYVGITLNPGNRFPQHEADKPWWTEVAGITLENYPDRESVLAAERRAIAVENPKYNKQRPSLTPKTTTRTSRLVWICEACRELVADGQGGLHVDDAAADRARAAWRTWDQSRTGHSWRAVDWNEIAALPTPAHWAAHHYECVPDETYFGYDIEVHRVRSQAQLLDWTAHLMEKSWLTHTDWSELIRLMAAIEA